MDQVFATRLEVRCYTVYKIYFLYNKVYRILKISFYATGILSNQFFYGFIANQ